MFDINPHVMVMDIDFMSSIEELVERATPKKVTKLSESYIQCNACNVIIELDEDKTMPHFCEFCGRKLDWEKEEI